MDVQVEPTPRKRGRPGLRNICNPVISHRNRYEKEFQNYSKDSFEKYFNYLNIGIKENQDKKIRSDPRTNKWMNNKKEKHKAPCGYIPKREMKDGMSKLMDFRMTRVTKDDKHTQVSVNEGITRHEDKALEPLLSDFEQLHKYNIFDPQYIDDLPKKTKYEALKRITMIKGKRYGKVKARACADGRKQRRYISKEEVSSPTMQLEILILSLIIDAKEGRDISIVSLTGRSVDIMCGVSKEYEKYVGIENGKIVLYLRLKKALYRCMQSSILWYDIFKGCLEERRFEINKYDRCVANKVINSKEYTIWYVDDTKISHMDPKVVEEVIKTIEKRFGKMTVT